MGTSLRELSLILIALSVCIEGGCAQRPILDLFGGGASVTTLEVLVDTPDEFTVFLVQNDNTEELITDEDEDIQYVVAKINGGGEESEDIVIDASGISFPVFTDVREDGEVEIRLFNATAANFSRVLRTLSYRSNLTSSALSDPQRNVTITAHDQVGPGNTLTALIDLRVPNQQAPTFTDDATYAVSIAENTAFETQITSVSATDPEGRSVAYSTGSSVFAVDSSTGVVSVLDSSALNYEFTTSFVVTIVASDEDPFSPMSAEAMLTVTLTNTNDNNPVFTQDTYEANVPENVANAFVVALSATDEDGDSLEYFFSDTSTATTFHLDSDTGTITVLNQLDYEITTEHTFGVLVSDGEQSDTATVVVTVTDVADGRPVVLPLQKDILLNLDDGKFPIPLCILGCSIFIFAGETDVLLRSGTGGPLQVDDDSPRLQKGVLNITRVVEDTVCGYNI